MEKKCITCGEIKSLEHYHIQKKSRDGHNNKCGSCVNIYNSIRNKTRPRADSDLRAMMIVHPSKNDYRVMYQAMISMGYDVNQNVHEQFCLKHNLPYKERKRGQQNKWSYTDLI